MTVLCANCHTANRDRAMFCIGCAAKLPAFSATGPSALDTVGAPLGQTAKPSSATRTEADATHARTTGTAPRGLMLAVLLLGATVLALAAWISFGPERAAAPGVASAAAPLQTLPATPVAAPAPVAVAPPVQVPLDSALAPGESMVPTMPRPASAPITASAPPATKAPAAPISQRPPTTTVARVNSGDPRAGCEHLFFVLAARCEAEHCNQAAYARHPRCDVVREQRRRDEARRNLTSGY
ncbi:MAG: hypothetical protein EOO22_25585 [Comamonadaceae bacterium]|nr:MAG: hypothetical protein EOO22_25585 [Comamonadaceae bacterium]